MRSRSDRAMLVNSSQDEGGELGVWLRVRILNSLVLSSKSRAFIHPNSHLFGTENRATELAIGMFRRSCFDMPQNILRPFYRQSSLATCRETATGSLSTFQGS